MPGLGAAVDGGGRGAAAGSEVGLDPPAGPPAAPVLDQTNAQAPPPAVLSHEAHLPAGTVPPAVVPDPDQHATHRDLPTAAIPTSIPEPDLIHPTSTFPLRPDVEHAPALDPAPSSLPTSLAESAEASVAGAVASATGFVDATEAALDRVVSQATAPDPDDLDPALAPFRLDDPQAALPRTTGGHSLPVHSAETAHPAGAAAALKNVNDKLVHVEGDGLHWQPTGDAEDNKEQGRRGGIEVELVPGLGNDKLFAMMRRFNAVSADHRPRTDGRPLN